MCVLTGGIINDLFRQIEAEDVGRQCGKNASLWLPQAVSRRGFRAAVHHFVDGQGSQRSRRYRNRMVIQTTDAREGQGQTDGQNAASSVDADSAKSVVPIFGLERDRAEMACQVILTATAMAKSGHRWTLRLRWPGPKTSPAQESVGEPLPKKTVKASISQDTSDEFPSAKTSLAQESAGLLAASTALLVD